jgi:hypothetical protein
VAGLRMAALLTDLPYCSAALSGLLFDDLMYLLSCVYKCAAAAASLQVSMATAAFLRCIVCLPEALLA